MTSQQKQAKGGNVFSHNVLGNRDCDRSVLESARWIWVSEAFLYE
jgi:hypothetical protein